MHVKQYGLAEVVDPVLASCLKDPAYDRQCERSRAAWLFEMFRGTPQYARFAVAIRSALAHETEHYDVEHLCELLALMGRDGDAAAATALRGHVLDQSFSADHTQAGCHALVVLDGGPAVVELVRRFARILAESPEAYMPSLEYLCDGTDVLPQAETTLRELAPADGAIQAFLRNREAVDARSQDAPEVGPERRQQAIRERNRGRYPLEKILEDATAGAGDRPSRYMTFGRYATAAELNTVLQRLATEADPKACLRLLWVFRRASLPAIPPRIWEFTRAEDGAMRAAAIEALAQVRDPRIGEFGRAKLRSPEFRAGDSEVLDIFIRNYQPLDEELIMAALERLKPGDDDAHALGSAILDICERNASPALAAMLEWVYRTNPCTICRESAVKHLMDMGCLASGIAEECLHDASEDVRRLVQPPAAA